VPKPEWPAQTLELPVAGRRSPTAEEAAPSTGPERDAIERPGSEVVDDGQEEVFSKTAVARGAVEDPKALGPDDLARAPKSPGAISSR